MRVESLALWRVVGIALFLTVFHSKTWAQHGDQPGYIVQLSGDTLRGTVEVGRDLRNGERCYFRSGAGAEMKQFTPRQLRAYGVTGLAYESHSLPNSAAVPDTASRAFVEVLVRGALTLYYRQSPKGERFFLGGHRPNQLTELPLLVTYATRRLGDMEHSQKISKPSYRDTLTRAFQACPAVLEQVKSVTFQAKSLTQVVQAYNSCVSPAAATKNREGTLRNHWQIAPVLGVGLSDRMKLGEGKGDRSLDADYQGATYFTGGLSFLFTPGFRGAPFSANISLLYEANRRYTKEYAMPGDNYQRVNLAFDYLRLPIFLRYTFGQGFLRPYLEAGGTVHVVTTQRQDKLTFLQNGAPISAIAVFDKPQRMGYGYGLGAGLALGPPQGRQVQISVRLIKASGPSPFTSGSTITSVAAYVAYPLTK
jgi:hypothetical protein